MNGRLGLYPGPFQFFWVSVSDSVKPLSVLLPVVGCLAGS